MAEIKKHFDISGDKFTCKICGVVLTSQKTGTTSHLWNHMKNKHQDVHDKSKLASTKRKLSDVKPGQSSRNPSEPDTKRQLSISDFGRVKSLPSVMKKKYDHAVLSFIVCDGRPFEAAGGKGLMNLCSVLTGGEYAPPHPTTLSRRLGDLRESIEKSLREHLKSDIVGTRVSITFDHWKADNGSNYLVLTLHYVDKAWKFVTRCLAVVNLEIKDADHTAACTEQMVTEQLDKYGISIDSIMYATTDTTSVMPCTARLLGIQWMGCAAHRLQLCINAALDVQHMLKNLISNVHRIAGFFNSSTVGLANLHKHQKETTDPNSELSKLPESNPPIDVSTRFNSTYYLLNWVNRNQVAISLALVECQGRKNCASKPPQPISVVLSDILQSVLPVLKPTAEATEILSADQYVTIFMIVPCITTLRKQMLLETAKGVKTFRDELVKQLDKRFQLEEPHLQMTTYLDPRFKNNMMGDELDTDTKLAAVKQLIESDLAWHGLNKPTEGDKTILTVETSISESTSGTVASSSVKGSSSLMDAMFADIKKSHENNPKKNNDNTLSNRLASEMDRYSSMPLIEKEECPLVFWKNHELAFPLLATVARDTFGIQATNCSSERVNSTGGNIISDKRHSLSHYNAETLIWAKNISDFVLSKQ